MALESGPQLRHPEDHGLLQQVGDHRRRCGRPAGQVLDEQNGGERSRAKEGGGLGVEGQPRQGGQGAALGAQDELDALLGCGLGKAPAEHVQRGATVALGELAALGGLVDFRQTAPVALTTWATIFSEIASISASVRVRSVACNVTAMASDFLPSGTPLPV